MDKKKIAIIIGIVVVVAAAAICAFLFFGNKLGTDQPANTTSNTENTANVNANDNKLDPGLSANTQGANASNANGTSNATGDAGNQAVNAAENAANAANDNELSNAAENQSGQRASTSETTQNIESSQNTLPEGAVSSKVLPAEAAQQPDRSQFAQECATAFLSGLSDPANFAGVDIDGARAYPYNRDRNMLVKKLDGAGFVDQSGFVFRNIESVSSNMNRDGEMHYRIVAVYEIPGRPQVTRTNSYNAVVSDIGLVYLGHVD